MLYFQNIQLCALFLGSSTDPSRILRAAWNINILMWHRTITPLLMAYNHRFRSAAFRHNVIWQFPREPKVLSYSGTLAWNLGTWQEHRDSCVPGFHCLFVLFIFLVGCCQPRRQRRQSKSTANGLGRCGNWPPKRVKDKRIFSSAQRHKYPLSADSHTTKKKKENHKTRKNPHEIPIVIRAWKKEKRDGCQGSTVVSQQKTMVSVRLLTYLLCTVYLLSP